MIQDKWDDDWQRTDRRFEPTIVLTLALGLAIATFLAAL